MDINRGLLYSGNNEAIYKKTLIDFYQDSKRRQKRVQTLADTDIDQYRFEVHALKGIARNIGALRLSEMAYLHEEAVTEQDATYVAEHLEKLMNLWEQTMREIESYVGLEALGDELEIETDGVTIPQSEINAAAKLCILHLQHYEAEDALNVIRKVLSHELPPEVKDAFHLAYREVDDFEYESAIAVLQSLVQE